jgi:hypothetical protein
MTHPYQQHQCWSGGLRMSGPKVSSNNADRPGFCELIRSLAADLPGQALTAAVARER